MRGGAKKTPAVKAAGLRRVAAGARPRGAAKAGATKSGAVTGAAAMASAAAGAKGKPRKTKVAPKARASKPRIVDDNAVAAIVRTLHELYPEAQTALRHENPLQLLIATILSAQSTDEMVNQVTVPLFKKYRTAAEFAAAHPATFETEIHSTGFFRNKTKSVLGAAKRLRDVYGGEVPQTMEELLTLPGVARKTANVVLGSAFGIAVGVVVDTHVRRLSNRLGMSLQDDPVKIEQDLIRRLPREEWIFISHGLILHGRAICQARKPYCSKCPLATWCPRNGVTVAA